jgi:hypothetical protein
MVPRAGRAGEGRGRAIGSTGRDGSDGHGGEGGVTPALHVHRDASLPK